MAFLKPCLALFALLAGIALPCTSVFAATIKTNDPDFVVKELSCIDTGVSGVLVNKGEKAFAGILHIAVKDTEGDVIGRNQMRIRVSAENAAKFSFYYINTLNCLKHQFDFEVD